MRSIGLLELLILLGVVGVSLAILVLVRGGRIRAWLLRIGERSVYREQQPGRPRSALRMRWIPFPRALATAVCSSVGLFGIVVSSLSTTGRDVSPFSPKETEPFVSLASGLALIVSILVGAFGGLRAVYLHFRPAHDRRLKYDWFLAGVCSGAVGFVYSYIQLIVLVSLAVNASPGEPETISINTTLVVLVAVLLNPALWILAFGVSVEPWRRKLGCLPLGRLRRTHALVRRLAVPAMIFSWHPIWLIYLWLRYSILERFSASPILYLRSFRYSSTATAYGRIVAKATRSFGVVVAIVHEAQPGSTLMRYTSVLDQPQVGRPADPVWRDWVREELARASVVLIDATVLTENVNWEIHSAISAVTPKRIAVLVERGSKVEAPDGIARIEYALDNRSVGNAVAELKKWLAQAVPEDLVTTRQHKAGSDL